MFSFICMRPLVSKLNALVTRGFPLKIGTASWLTCLLTVGLFGNAFGQDIRYTKGNVDSALRSNLEVDPSTFGMSVNVPLAEYPGRGNALPVNLRYGSKLWRIDFMDSFNLGGLPRTRNEGKWAEDNVAGWTSSLALPKVEAAFEYRGPYDGAGQQTCFVCTPPPPPTTAEVYINRLLLTMPDGSSHELRKDDSITYSRTPDAGIYYAVDSSNIRYESANAIIYLPDGSRYLLSVNNGTQAQFVDRHGNTMTYTFSTKQWTDTLGRQIGFNLSNQSVGDVVNTLPGVGGSTLNYTLRWRSLHDSLSSGSVAVIGSYDYVLSNNPMLHTGASLFTSYLPTGFKFGYVVSDDAPYYFDPIVLKEIVLPNGRTYTFTYNQYAEIDKIVMPTGGYERFAYGTVPGLSGSLGQSVYEQANRGVKDRWVSVTGDGTDEATRHWTYSTDVTGPYIARVVNPNGTKSERLLHQSLSDQNFGFDDPRSGRAYEERLFAANGTMLRRVLTDWVSSGALPGAPATGTPKRNPRATKTIEILLDTNGGNAKAKTTTMVYDVENPNYYGTGLNVIETKHYDYADVSQTTGQTATIGSIPLGTPINTEKMMYLLNDPAYAGVGFYYGARNMIALPTATWIENPSGVTTARTEFKYDEAGYPLLAHPGSVNATQWIDPQNTYRGTVTTTRRWLNMMTDTNTAATTVSSYPSGTWLETHTQTDVCGSVRKSWDARQKVSEVNYNATYAFAYPVEVKTPPPNPNNTIGGLSVPYATNQALASMMTYDFTTGKPLTVTDPNLQVTTNSYAGDSLQRLTKVTRPTGGGETIYEYNDTPGSCACDLSIKTRTLQSGTTYIEDYAFFDGIGRAWRSAHGETGGKWSVKDTQYDNLGRVWKTANPVLTGVVAIPNRGSFALVNTDLTVMGYDELDRPLAITTPDSSVVYTAYSGNQVTVADQANGTANPINGNAPRNTMRRSITDGLGRLTQVIEAPGSLSYTTNYTYDSLNNLVKVDQGGQLRFFMYDSASRLVRAKNPEQENNTTLNLTDAVTGNGQWTMEYAYDGSGNLQKRWDARGVTATYTYDDINRNLKVNYGGSGSSPTPTVERYYDAATLGKGKPWRTISYNNHPQNAAQLAYQYRFIGAYDNVGRPTSGEQWFLNSTNNTWVTYPMSRSYDLASHVTAQSYPSTRAASYSYGTDGRLSGFTGNLGDGVPRTYADTMLYNAAGQMTQERFVTSTNLYHSMTYNKRFQMYDNRLGTSVLGWNRGLLLTYYSVGARQIGWPGYETSGNNGNVWMQEHYVPTNDALSSHTIFRDYYEYDDLNRIKEDNGVQKDTANNWTTPHKQSFNYDQWGNRTINAGGTFGAGINNKSFEIDTTTNRMSKPGADNCGPGFSGMCYDKAGNQVFDDYSTPTTMSGGLREYDGENRLTKANGPGGFNYYGYDADGQRIRRVVWESGLLKEYWQVYGFDGELIAEYPVNGVASTPQKEYGYRGDQLLVVAGCDVARWIVSDHLGTPRIEVDVTGSLANVRRHDYLPFGEELTVGMGNSSLRTAGMGYAADCVRQDFGGYERDSETDLDFAEARYFSSKQGRFTSPDPFLGSAELFQPQSWNRYSYVLNNPLLYTDPTGLIWVNNNEDGKYYWINDDVWEEASKKTFNDGRQLYTPLTASQLEYESAGNHVSLDPRGPNPLNPAGFTLTPSSSNAGAIALGGLATTQIDSPLPGPADVVGLSMVAYAIYSWMTQEYGPLPIVDPNIFNKKAGDSGKGERHGDSKAHDKVAKQIEELEEKIKAAVGREKKKLEQTLKNVKKAADRAAKGETHWN